MPKSQTVSEFRHGGAERYEVLIDFSKFRPGTRIVLNNLSNDNNRDFLNTDKVMAFDVVDDPFDKSDPTWNRIPERLADSHVMHLRPGDGEASPHAQRRALPRQVDHQRADLGVTWSPATSRC